MRTVTYYVVGRMRDKVFRNVNETVDLQAKKQVLEQVRFPIHDMARQIQGSIDPKIVEHLFYVNTAKSR